MGLGRSHLLGNSLSAAKAGLLGSYSYLLFLQAFCLFSSNSCLFSPHFPWTFLLVEAHTFSHGETPWIAKAKHNALGNLCINNLVFQLVSRTIQHKPSKENTTCVLTASAWWRIGFLGRIISQKEELTWCDQELGAFPECESVTRTRRVCTEFPFFAKTPQTLRKSKPSGHRSSADKSWDRDNSQMVGRRAVTEAGHRVDHPQGPGWISEAILSVLLSPAKVFSDQRPIQSLRAPGKVALLCQQPFCIQATVLYLIEIFKLQSECFVSPASFLEDLRLHVNKLPVETHHNIPHQSQWLFLRGENSYWGK